MADHRLPEPMRSRTARLLMVLAAAAGVAALAVGPAAAAPKAGAANGHLILTVDDVAATAGPGKALKLALAECADRAGDVVVTVDDVRAAFPAAVAVCDGVTLTSQVAADDDEAAAV
jgi:hypothetical protein